MPDDLTSLLSKKGVSRLMKTLKRALKSPERTLTIIKPDGVANHLTGKVINELEKEHIKPVAMKMIKLNKFQAAYFYRHLYGKLPSSVFKSMLDYMTSDRVILIVWQGRGAVNKVRKVCGPTDPSKAGKRQLRSLSSQDMKKQLAAGRAVKNIVHASDSRESARREIGLFFLPWEING
jgi:nucleoside-diphosphate kinase